MNKKLFVIISILLTATCCKHETKTNYQKLVEFCVNHSSIKNLNSYNSIIIIDDKTTCLNCTNMFAKAMASRLDKNNNLLFIISDNGARVDISKYIEKNRSNVILDFHNHFDRLNIVNGSAIINIKNHKIISKTIINAQNVNKYK